MSFLLKLPFSYADVPVVEDPNVSLTRTEEDGSVTQVLCWHIDGKILVHPDRWEQFKSLLKDPCNRP